MDAEQAETYLRLAAEAALRSADRAAGRKAPAVRLVRAIADAFEGVGALPAEVAERVVDGLQSAVSVRSPAALAPGGQGTSSHPGRPWIPGWSGGHAFTGGAPVRVSPVGQRLSAGREESDVGIYLLALASSPTERVLSTVIRLLRPGQGAPFDLGAVDPAGRPYRLRFIGGGDGTWLTGEFRPGPRPPDGTPWLDVSYGMRTVRVDLTSVSGSATASMPPAEATVTPVRLSPGEAYLRSRADGWLSMSLREDLGDLVATVPALTAIGALPASSELPAKIAALRRRDRVGLPDHWADALAARDPTAAPPASAPPARRLAAAHIAAALPPVDGVTVVLAALTSGARSSLHGVVVRGSEPPASGRPTCWIRDWTGGVPGPWRPVWTGPWDWQQGLPGMTFYATLSPPIPSSATSAEVLITGRTAEARAMVPLSWWLR